MAGCGIRGLRWGLGAADRPAEVELWINDADPDRACLLAANLQPLRSASALTLRTSHLAAERLLRQAYLDQTFFDLIDLDAFGCPNALLQSALAVLRFGGVLILASTDGRSPTGMTARPRFALWRRSACPSCELGTGAAAAISRDRP